MEGRTIFFLRNVMRTGSSTLFPFVCMCFLPPLEASSFQDFSFRLLLSFFFIYPCRVEEREERRKEKIKRSLTDPTAPVQKRIFYSFQVGLWRTKENIFIPFNLDDNILYRKLRWTIGGEEKKKKLGLHIHKLLFL